MSSKDRRSSEGSKSTQQGFPGQEIDALRRHICQILGFDIALIDIVRGSNVDNLISFFSDQVSEYTPENLADINGEPLSKADNKLSKQVRQSYAPFTGRVFGLDDDIREEEAGFPYIIVPISDGQGNASTMIKGLIRVVSFDTTRTIEATDVSNVRLIGQHLATRMPNLSAMELNHGTVSTISQSGGTTTNEASGTGQLGGNEQETVVVAHSNRATRRRFARTLSSEFSVIETDDPEKVMQALQSGVVSLAVLDSQINEASSGKMLCRVLKDSASQWRYIPVVLIAPEADPNSKIEGLNSGADDCVSDACHDAELLARVRASLRLRKTERELATQLQLLEEYAQKLEYVTEVERLASSKIALEQMDLKVSKQQLQILRNQDEILRRISDCIRKSFNIDDNVDEMLESLAGWLDLDCCFVALTEECDPQDIIRREYATYEGYRLMDNDYDLSLLDTFKHHFRTNRGIVLINDVKNDSRVEPYNDVLSHYLLYSVFYVAITYEEKLLGILGGHKCESQAQWTSDNEAFLGQVADQLAIGVTNARLYKRVERQATTDGLTSLFNHRTGQEKLAEQLRLAERYSRNISVVMMDIDHFKSINDTYGHPVGDTVLKTVAGIIKRDCRDVDIPVRYGGEEFLLVLPEVTQEGAIVVAERLRKTLQRENISHDDMQLSVTASLGVASYPEDAINQRLLLDLADKALYMSKRLGRNRVHTAADLMFQEFDRKEEVATKSSDISAGSVGDRSTTSTRTDLAAATAAGQPDSASDESAGSHSSDDASPADSTSDEQVIEMIKAMAGALYSKSEYNKVHHLYTARFAELVAKVLGLDYNLVEQIRVAGLLHDVGLLNVPEEIINKPGQVSPEELRVLMQHPMMGADLIRPVPELKEICEILENHHECWDGTGYPRGLKGDDIPVAARIVSIVDAYHAMISDRPYRQAMPKEKAKRVLRNGAGSQFDPFLVDIFMAVLAENEQPGTGQPQPS